MIASNPQRFCARDERRPHPYCPVAKTPELPCPWPEGPPGSPGNAVGHQQCAIIRFVSDTATSHDALTRRAERLEYATIGWNIGEAVLTIALGSVAASLALIGFGTVSVVEVFASGVVVWHLRPSHPAEDAARERRALRLTAYAFAVLGTVLAVAAVNDLVSGRRADESFWGIVYLAITAVVMFALAVAKRRTAAQLDSAPLRAEATLTFLDGVLSTSTLVGLALNAYVGWWWADPAAALIVAFAAFGEARENYEASAKR